MTATFTTLSTFYRRGKTVKNIHLVFLLAALMILYMACPASAAG